MFRFIVSWMSGLVLILASPAPPTPALQAVGSSADTIVQYHHDLAIPEEIHGAWIYVRGTPGTEFELWVEDSNGTELPVGAGVIPPWGVYFVAHTLVHRHVPQRHSRGALWSRSDAQIVAAVELLD